MDNGDTDDASSIDITYGNEKRMLGIIYRKGDYSYLDFSKDSDIEKASEGVLSSLNLYSPTLISKDKYIVDQSNAMLLRFESILKDDTEAELLCEFDVCVLNTENGMYYFLYGGYKDDTIISDFKVFLNDIKIINPLKSAKGQ